MEFFVGIIMVVAGIVALIMFKKPIKKTAIWADMAVTASISEAQVELTERANEAWEELIDRCGEDFKTPDEVYNLMMKRRKKKQQNTISH